MNVLLFGATGMIGSGALIECIEDPRVTTVIVIGRASAGVRHPKVREIIHADFFDYAPVQGDFAGIDACFFCLGVSSAGMKGADYHHLTYDLTLGAATAIAAVNTNLTFCYVSGVGTDSTERGRLMWARVKGKTENALLRMPFKAAFMFRPGYIQPTKGVRSKTPLYQGLYDTIGVLYPLLRWLAPTRVTTTADFGRALINVAASGYPQPVLYTSDINRMARGLLRSGADRA